MSKEAMKLALELKNSASAYWTEKEIPIIEKLIKLLALAEQPAQQELPACISCGAAPTRYVDEGTDFPGTYCDHCGPGGVPSQQEPDYKALYEKAVEQYNELADLMAEQPAPMIRGDIRDGLVDDEPAQQQEPVAWKYKVDPAFDGQKWHDRYDLTESKSLALWKDKDAQPLYTSPPASKPWVGLTRDERMDIINRFAGQDWVYAVEAIEAKLREKNAAPCKPLTDEQIEDIWADCPADWDDKINVLTLARAIEAAHGIKGDA